MFTENEMTYFAKDYGIQLIQSTPFYPQANRQAKASNKVLINIMVKMLRTIPEIGTQFYLRPYGLIELLKEIL